MNVTVSAFSFLQKKLKGRLAGYYDVPVLLEEGGTVSMLICGLGLDEGDVEGAFVNGGACCVGTVLHDGDRVGLVPPGTPGPHRVYLGLHPRVKKVKVSGKTRGLKSPAGKEGG